MEDKSLKDIRIMDERKLKEIEHSRLRRSTIQGFERLSDTHRAEEVDNLESLIRDKEAFKKHFSNIKFYSITNSSEAYKQVWLKGKCGKGTKVLDFACGNGENGIYAAQCGADTTGIDISPEGVENANLNAVAAGVADHCKFLVMDGENMDFPDSSFDFAVEYGALHHVDLERAMSELARVLKPMGEMICIEALRHNPFIHWYRRRTPHLRTKWEVEHIMGVQDLDVVKAHFQQINLKFFHLAVLAAVPFRKTSLFQPLRSLFDRIDSALLKNSTLGKFGWIMIFTISMPKK